MRIWRGARRYCTNAASTLSAYRLALAQAGLDLDSEPRACALVLQAYAAARVAERAELGEVGAATHNQRIAIVSSFYRYAQRYGALTINPAALVQRRTVHAYATRSRTRWSAQARACWPIWSLLRASTSAARMIPMARRSAPSGSMGMVLPASAGSPRNA